MKQSIPFSIAALFCASGLATAEPVYTTPVGYVTTTINGNTSGSRALTLISPTLVNPSNFTGTTTLAPSSKTATFSGEVPTGLDDAYMLEIAEGDHEGWWTSITSSTLTSVTVHDDFPLDLPANTKMVIRKFNTVQNVFGNNSLGLDSENDFIEILDPVSKDVAVIVYFDGWFDLTTENPAEDFIIYPGTAVRVVRVGATALELVTTGEVKTTQTQVDVFSGETWIGHTLAAGASFANMNIGSQIDESDTIVVYEPDTGSGQDTTAYVAFAGEMYNLVTEASAEDVVFGPGNGFLINRPNIGATTITFPAPNIAK